MQLDMDEDLVRRCHSSAQQIADGVMEQIHGQTTDSVERTILRLLGIDGVDASNVPLPNVLVNQIREAGKLQDGAFHILGNAVVATGRTPQELALAVGEKELSITTFPEVEKQTQQRALAEFLDAGVQRILTTKSKRERHIQQLGEGPKPWLYVIVATGNIYEDARQAKAAAHQGADVVAVIRSTAQSLLDYVPFGPTTEGFGGTYATQENFRIMRRALDEAGEERGRYVRLVNYASGLCMPEIAVMGAMEGLDMMLNDAMYGILFRDIAIHRTLIDQHFSRIINGYANIIINTGEDNYLTTADAVTEGHTVLASQFINQELAHRSGMPDELIGLGHAFEINPQIENGFLLELASAQLVRQLFPHCPIKYMPPTKYMNGNIFRGHIQDALFNLVGITTNQSIQLLGMMTEAIHTPFVQDRALSLENARYVMNNARALGEELQFQPGGKIQSHAHDLLSRATTMLENLAEQGLEHALEEGLFAGIKRPLRGGKGHQGVVRCSDKYQNPFMEIFSGRMAVHGR